MCTYMEICHRYVYIYGDISPICVHIWRYVADMCTYMVICHSDILTVKHVSGNNSRENQNTILCPLSFFPKMKPFM